MDTAMRDLDQLRERGDEGTGRKLTVAALGTLVVVAAVFAMGILVGSSDATGPEPSADPLAQLDRAAGTEPPKVAAAAPAPVEVDAEDLSFPAALTTDPLVEAAVRAAAREHSALAPGGSAATAELPAPGPRNAPLPSAPSAALGRLDATALPAGAAASGHGERLARVAQHDPLVAAALPRAPDTERAASGHPGKFMLQVVSYESRPAADDFADALRGRGHTAFVMSADVPGRGRYFRVRIGPFETRAEALRYQHDFERDERMHTLVVRKSDDEE